MNRSQLEIAAEPSWMELDTRHLLRLVMTLCLCGTACTQSPPPRQESPPDTGEVRDVPTSSVEVDTVVYHFRDATVAPQYHRSVTITATPSSILRVVDSYGDEIERQERPLSRDEFQSLVDAFAAARLRENEQERAELPCVGGTGESLTVSNQGVQLFSGSVEHCGGDRRRDFTGDLQRVVAALTSSVASQGETDAR